MNWGPEVTEMALAFRAHVVHRYLILVTVRKRKVTKRNKHLLN